MRKPVISLVVVLAASQSGIADAQCVLRYSCGAPNASDVACKRCFFDCGGNQAGQCTGCWDSCTFVGPGRTVPCPETGAVVFGDVGGMFCGDPGSGTPDAGLGSYDCNPSRPCSSGKSCVPKLNPNGTMAGGTQCVPSGCRLTPTPGTNPGTYSYRCGGGEGPRGPGGLDHPNRPSSGSGRNPTGGPSGKSPSQSNTCEVGGSPTTGDPVSIADQRTVMNFVDVTLRSTTEPLSLHRSYESDPVQWNVANSLGYPDGGFVALPFGTDDVSGARSVRWWHSLFSFAFKPSFSSIWQVRLPGGEVVTFDSCTIQSGQTSCMASTTYDAMEARARSAFERNVHLPRRQWEAVHLRLPPRYGRLSWRE